MKKYFLEPITGNLIIVDTNNGNTTVCPELKNVRVFTTGGSAFMTQGHEDNDMQSAVKEKKNSNRRNPASVERLAYRP